MTVSQVARYLSITDPSDIEAAMCYLNASMEDVRKLTPDQIEHAADRMCDYESIPAIYQERLWLKSDGTWNRHGDGVEYGVLNDWEKLTGGEYFDIHELKQNFYPNATKILAVLYRPVAQRYGKSYRVQPYEGVDGHERFGTLPAQYLHGVMLFFCNVTKNCARTSLSYLKATANTTSLAKSGATTGLLRKWLVAFSRSNR
jgi:hypothetical protein